MTKKATIMALKLFFMSALPGLMVCLTTFVACRFIVCIPSTVLRGPIPPWSIQGPVNLDYVVWNIKGSMSCTDIPFNDSSVIIIYHLLAISNGLITFLVSVLYYHLSVDADNQYRSAGVLHFIYLTILSVFLFLTKKVILILCICIA